MKGKVLMIVDPQVDFINGSLSVSGAPEAMDALADYVGGHGGDYRLIVVTADRHPETHCSFVANGGQWPAHCVADTDGASIWPALESALDKCTTPVLYLYKGAVPDKEEYSIFQAPSEARKLKRLLNLTDISEMDVCGIAGDVCVAATLQDAVKRHPRLKFHLLTDYTPSLDGGETVSRLVTTLG